MLPFNSVIGLSRRDLSDKTKGVSWFSARLRNLSAVKAQCSGTFLAVSMKDRYSGNRAQMDRTMQIYHTGCLVKSKIGYCFYSIQ